MVYLGVDLQMQLAHAWDDGFFALGVKSYSESGVLSGETVDAFREFVQVVLVKRKKKKTFRDNPLLALISGFFLKRNRFTLFDGLIAMEMTGSGTWMDSCVGIRITN